MDYQLLALAVAPGLAIAIYIYWRDKFEKEPLRLLLISFVLGALSAFPAIVLEHLGDGFARNATTSPLINTAIYAFLVVGFSEEFSKFLFLRSFAYKKPAFNEPYDGITYAVMVSMGFATFENVGYVFMDNVDGYKIALMRMFTAVPAHATFGVIMGYFVGLAKFKKRHEVGLLLLAILMAALFHGAYDFFLMQEYSSYITVGAFVSLIVGIYLSFKAIKIHQAASPFKESNDRD